MKRCRHCQLLNTMPPRTIPFRPTFRPPPMTYKPPIMTYKPSITTPKSPVVAAKPSYYVLPYIYRTVFVYVEPLTNLAMFPAFIFAHQRLLAFFAPLVALELDASSLDFIFFNPITRYLTLL